MRVGARRSEDTVNRASVSALAIRRVRGRGARDLVKMNRGIRLRLWLTRVLVQDIPRRPYIPLYISKLRDA